MQPIQGASRHPAVAMVPTGSWPIPSFLAGSVPGTNGVPLPSPGPSGSGSLDRTAASSPRPSHYRLLTEGRGSPAVQPLLRGQPLELPTAGTLPVPHVLPQALPARLLGTGIRAEDVRCRDARRGLASNCSWLRTKGLGPTRGSGWLSPLGETCAARIDTRTPTWSLCFNTRAASPPSTAPPLYPASAPKHSQCHCQKTGWTIPEQSQNGIAEGGCWPGPLRNQGQPPT